MFVFGMDVGFVKTGFGVIELGDRKDKLILATTLKSGINEEKKTDDYVALQDAHACFTALDKWNTLFNLYKPSAVFCEIPSAGAQGARANRCMGMATALIVGFLHEHKVEHFELYIPTEVESSLGIKLTPREAKIKGLTKAGRTAWKKDRLKGCATSAFPEFKGWPEHVTVAEDSYDAVCAYLCGKQKSPFYSKLKGNGVCNAA